MQELLRHANSKIMMDIYTQALSAAEKTGAHLRASMILSKNAAANEASEGR
jgi:hypothetical protein